MESAFEESGHSLILDHSLILSLAPGMAAHSAGQLYCVSFSSCRGLDRDSVLPPAVGMGVLSSTCTTPIL